MGMIYLFASVSIASLVGIYSNALVNCYFTWEWLSHSKAMRDFS